MWYEIFQHAIIRSFISRMSMLRHNYIRRQLHWKMLFLSFVCTRTSVAEESRTRVHINMWRILFTSWNTRDLSFWKIYLQYKYEIDFVSFRIILLIKLFTTFHFLLLYFVLEKGESIDFLGSQDHLIVALYSINSFYAYAF